MTFNTQHCALYTNYLKNREQKIDTERFAQEISKVAPDIVGLNEIRGNDTRGFYGEQTELLKNFSGMPYSFFAPAIRFDDGPYGNAMLSRLEPLSVENIKIPDPEERKYDGYYETRCLIKAKFEGGLTVLITHFGLNPDEFIKPIQAERNINLTMDMSCLASRVKTRSCMFSETLAEMKLPSDLEEWVKSKSGKVPVKRFKL